jgi:bacteriocin biosynthesis cyclodehydratase domain-containing protein
LRGPGHEDLALEGDPEFLARLLPLMDGTLAVSELAGKLAVPSETLAAAVGELVEADVVDDAREDIRQLGSHDAHRYERQLAYFADLARGGAAAAAAQRRLREATVCLLGLGGLGSWTAWGIACAGIGAIVGIDCDHVDLSNLNRQILFGEPDLGARKVDAAGSALNRFDSQLRYSGIHTRLDGVAKIESVIEGADFVVTSVDAPAHRIGQWVNQACFSRGVPYIAVSQHPPKLRIGPLYVPGETGCLACQEADYRRHYPLYAELESAAQPVPPSATFGPACGVVGALAANEVVAHLTGLHRPACRGSALILDLTTHQVEREEIPHEPACSICGPAVARPSDGGDNDRAGRRPALGRSRHVDLLATEAPDPSLDGLGGGGMR